MYSPETVVTCPRGPWQRLPSRAPPGVWRLLSAALYASSCLGPRWLRNSQLPLPPPPLPPPTLPTRTPQTLRCGIEARTTIEIANTVRIVLSHHRLVFFCFGRRGADFSRPWALAITLRSQIQKLYGTVSHLASLSPRRRQAKHGSRQLLFLSGGRTTTQQRTRRRQLRLGSGPCSRAHGGAWAQGQIWTHSGSRAI